MNHNSYYVTVTVRQKALIGVRPCRRGLTIFRSREDRGSVDGGSTMSRGLGDGGPAYLQSEKGIYFATWSLFKPGRVVGDA